MFNGEWYTPGTIIVANSRTTTISDYLAAGALVAVDDSDSATRTSRPRIYKRRDMEAERTK